MMDKPVHQIIRIVRKFLQMKYSVHDLLNNDNKISLFHVFFNILNDDLITYTD